jgi:hypothetical protein
MIEKAPETQKPVTVKPSQTMGRAEIVRCFAKLSQRGGAIRFDPSAISASRGPAAV